MGNDPTNVRFIYVFLFQYFMDKQIKNILKNPV